MSKIEDINSIDGELTDDDIAAADTADESATPELTLFSKADDVQEGSDGDGYVVYEPPPIPSEDETAEGEILPETEEEPHDEWLALGDSVIREYGDTLTGLAGYMGPIGMLLTVVSGIILIFHLWTKLSVPMLLGSAGGFIVGVFLLLFHMVHWISNRSKGAQLAGFANEKLFGKPCSHLSVNIEDDGEGVSIRCTHFDMELSPAPECVVCGFYVARENGNGSEPGESEETVDAEDSEEEVDGEIGELSDG